MGSNNYAELMVLTLLLKAVMKKNVGNIQVFGDSHFWRILESFHGFISAFFFDTWLI